jgi:phosphomannomutase
VSNTGAIIRGDTITAIIAQSLLQDASLTTASQAQHNKGEIFYDVMSTKTIEEVAKKA